MIHMPGLAQQISSLQGKQFDAGRENIKTIPIETMGVNITTIDCLRVLIIKIGSTIILMVVEAQGYLRHPNTR